MSFRIGPAGWNRAIGWIARLVLILFIAMAVENWLDILVFRPEEYERLVGSEAGCGVSKSLCSWDAFLLDEAPFSALSILAAIALLPLRLPHREWTIRALALVICGFLSWKAYSTHLEALLDAAAPFARHAIA